MTDDCKDKSRSEEWTDNGDMINPWGSGPVPVLPREIEQGADEPEESDS